MHDHGDELVPLVFFEPGPPLALNYVLADHLDLWAVLLRLLYHSTINNFYDLSEILFYVVYASLKSE